VNGACGIANGFSTFIPQYNPIDILNCLEGKLRGDSEATSLSSMTPWYRNHNGTIELLVEDTPEQRVLAMQSYGCYEEQKAGKIVVTELPVGLHGEAYRKKLNEWRENFNKIRRQTLPGETKNKDETRAIKDFNNQCKKNIMRFEILGIENASYQSLGLVKRLGMTNMTLLESVNPVTVQQGQTKGATMEPYIPRTFKSIDEYMDQFIKVRLYYYNIRKAYLVKTKQSELETLRSKHRFIRDVVNKVVDVFSWKEEAILEKMAELGHAEGLYSQTPIRRFSPEEVRRLEEQINSEEQVLKQLSGTDPVQMWLSDLKEFRDLYLRHYKGEDGVRKTASRKVKLVKVKQGTQFTSDDLLELARLKGGHNDDEDETNDEETVENE
jgi:DNA topoisomerase-2